LQALSQHNKLSQTDSLSESADGPWEPLSTAYKKLHHSAETRTPPTIPTVEDWSVKRRIFGEYKVEFLCPQCSADLVSAESDIGQKDFCPHCGFYFILNDSVSDAISADRVRRHEKNQKKSEEKKQRQLERQAKRERKQQLKEEQQRRNEEQQRHVEHARLEKLEQQHIMNAHIRTEDSESERLVNTVTSSSQSWPIESDVNGWSDGRVVMCWYCGETLTSSLQCPFCAMLG